MEFSVIATSFNDEKNIEAFLDNFEKQTKKPSKVIVVDGGSTDNTQEVLGKLALKYSFELVTYFNLGRLNIAQGYNEAIKRCNTEWILVTGIGNEYDIKFCECLISKQKDSGSRVIYSPIVGKEINSFSKAFNTVFVGGRKGKIYSVASNRGVLINQSVYREIGLHYENFVYAGEDTEFFDRVRDNGIKMECAEDTFLIWETPKSFKEYLKKSRVNAISDMQLESKKKIIEVILSRAVIVGVLVTAALMDIRLFMVAILLMLMVIVLKQRSLNFKATILRMHFIFLPAWYYIWLWKYTKKEYHFKKQDIVMLQLK
jgi:glycosyltransferase involved in cell wall biosynthesis